ncbi:hypothetical protein, partial [Streptomyces sp. NPDC056468]|uniref:hypothetical protein n=1 Tax=Streptomyces sp. NPDC056468 TaxID=3345830 RepID=UPI0036CCF4C3
MALLEVFGGGGGRGVSWGVVWGRLEAVPVLSTSVSEFANHPREGMHVAAGGSQLWASGEHFAQLPC